LADKDLKDEISASYEEIYSKKIDSFKTLNKYIDKEKLKQIEDIITDDFSKRKINELHHNLLKNKIANLKDNNEGYYDYKEPIPKLSFYDDTMLNFFNNTFNNIPINYNCVICSII
jgi:hypothetical protein